MGSKWRLWLSWTVRISVVSAVIISLPTLADDPSANNTSKPPEPSVDVPLRGPVIKETTASDSHEIRKYSARHIRKDMWIAYRMAKAPWIDKAAAADPSIVAAICAHPGPARILAGHYRIAEVAQADHYLCRRLTRWKGATWALVHNPHADTVIALDPEGIYRAINRQPIIARILAHHIAFQEMIMNNPDLGQEIAMHMK